MRERELCEVLLFLCCHCKSFYTHIQHKHAQLLITCYLSLSLPFCAAPKSLLRLLRSSFAVIVVVAAATVICILNLHFAFILHSFITFASVLICVEIDHLPFSLRCALLRLSHIKMSQEQEQRQEQQQQREQRELLSELLRLLKALLTTLLQSPSQSQLAATPPKKKWIYRHYCLGMCTHTHAHIHMCVLNANLFFVSLSSLSLSVHCRHRHVMKAHVAIECNEKSSIWTERQ